MKFSSSAVVLATLAAGQAAAASLGHSHTASKHNHARRHAEMLKAQNGKRDNAKRDLNLLSALDSNKLTQLGVAALGINAVTESAIAWVGTDGQYTNEFINQSEEDISLVIWGPAGSWVNAVQPAITVSIPSNSSQTISFANGASGAWAPVYSDTTLHNGQINDTWGEFTFGLWGVVDVSREVNMFGRNMKIVGPKCTTDMTTCVFQCKDQSVASCMTNYELLNCDPSVQPGANKGTYDGADSGGCGGMGASAHLTTYLGF